jgi:hypothetical protein
MLAIQRNYSVFRLSKSVCMKTRLAGFIILLLISIAGCRKEAEPSITKEKIAGTYKLISVVNEMPDGSRQDLYASYDQCRKDEQHVFNVSQVYQVNNACETSTVTGPWCLITPQVLILNRIIYEVESFNGNELVIREDMNTEASGRQVKTFVRL